MRQLQAVCAGAVDDWLERHSLCLLLTHQGPDWLTPAARAHGDSEIAPAGRFAAHLFGHIHETEIVYVRRAGNTDAIRLCQGCSAFGMEHFGEPPKVQRSHGYSAGRIEIEGDRASLRLWPRIATNKTGPWRFIPDHEHTHLQSDQGTAADIFAVRSKRTAWAPKPKPKVATAALFIPHSTLPARRAFFGRDTELAIVARTLQPEHKGWGVVLDGPGGIGKTALALEAAHRAPAEHYPLKLFITAKSRRLDPDGVHALKDHRVENFYALLSEIGLALGREDVSRCSPEQRPQLIRHALASQPALLVLDDLESFSREERRDLYHLLEFLPSGCRAIFTSRRRDETAALNVRLDKLDQDAAMQLLATLGEHSRPIGRLTNTERERLYLETGGNPLLLTWTAGQLGRTRGRCRTVDEAVERLGEAHRLQKPGEPNDPLEFIFGDLLDTFTPAETAVLAALAYFNEAARLEWLLPLAELSETAARTALDDLRGRALLIEDEESAAWFLPPLAASFLRSRRPEAVGAAGKRLEAEAYALAMQYGGCNDNKAPFTELETAWPTVEAALPLLIAGDNARLQTVCDALDVFLNHTGRWNQWLSLSQEAEARALTAGDHDNAGWRAFRAGWVHYLRGEAEAVLACTERCAKYWRETGARQRAFAIRLRGFGYQLGQDYSAAITTVRESLELWRSLNPESDDVACGFNDLGSVKQESGDLDGAEADFREALRIARKLDYRECIVISTGNLAQVCLDRRDWPAAEQQVNESLELAKRLGHQGTIANNHHRLAIALLNQQCAAEALPHAKEAVDIYTPLRSNYLAAAQATLAECEAALL